jgi:uncharacterized repeat protein (TIGR02543 family)
MKIVLENHELHSMTILCAAVIALSLLLGTTNQKARYAITFDSQGGSALMSIIANEGTAAARPADPEKAGYTFLGWFSEAAGGVLYTWPHTLTADVTMYARWIPGVSLYIDLKPVTEDPPLSNVSIFVDAGTRFSAGTGYASWTWYWDGMEIKDANSNAYTLAANSQPAGIYELSVLVTTGDGEKLSVRCRVTIKAH